MAMNLRDDLKAYVDGELQADRAAEVSAAINADPVLQAEVDEMRLLTRSLKTFAEVPSPVGLERALRAVRPKQPWWSPSTASGRLAWGAGAILLVFVGFASMYRGGFGSQSMSESADKAPMSARMDTGRTPASVSMEPDKLVAPSPESAEQADMMAKSGRAKGSSGELPADGQAYGLGMKKETQLRLRVADAEKAKDEAIAVAAPLGGVAEPKSDGVVLQVPQSRYQEAMRQLREIGTVEPQTLPPTDEVFSDTAPREAAKPAHGSAGAQSEGAIRDEDFVRNGLDGSTRKGDQTNEPVASIDTTIVSEPPIVPPYSEGDNSFPTVLVLLLAVAGVAGLGVLIVLRRR